MFDLFCRLFFCSFCRFFFKDFCSALLGFCSFQTPFADMSKICADVSRMVDARLEEVGLKGYIRSLDVLTAVFYRDGGAYVIGRLSAEDEALPLVFCLRNRENGIELDAVLLDEDSVSILFSFDIILINMLFKTSSLSKTTY